MLGRPADRAGKSRLGNGSGEREDDTTRAGKVKSVAITRPIAAGRSAARVWSACVPCTGDQVRLCPRRQRPYRVTAARSACRSARTAHPVCSSVPSSVPDDVHEVPPADRGVGNAQLACTHRARDAPALPSGGSQATNQPHRTRAPWGARRRYLNIGVLRPPRLVYGLDGAFACLLRPACPRPVVATCPRDRMYQPRLMLREVTGMTVSPLNHYQVLMVDAEVDADILTTVFRRLVQRYQSSLDQSGSAMARLRAVYEAYAVLGDARRRARYDAQLEDLMWDAEPAPPVDVARPGRTPADRARWRDRSPQRPHHRQVPGRHSAGRPPAPQQVARAAVPVGAKHASSTRSVQVSVLDFGRYAGWSLRQLAARDPNYLEWLLRSPGWSSIPRRDHSAPATSLGTGARVGLRCPVAAQDFAAAAARAEAQSFWN